MDWRQLRGLTEYRSFEVRFFNNKDVNIALWDPEAEFYEEGKLIDALPVKDAQGTNPPVGPIDLPSRHSVYIPMIVEADGELLKKLKGSDRGRFVVPLGKLACSCALDCGGLCCVSSGDTTDRTALKGALRWRTSENSVKAKFSHKVHIPVRVG